jgi:short-subunit dehydrogenase
LIKKKIIILGSTSGLGVEIKKVLNKNKYKLYLFSSKNLDFSKKTFKKKINYYLKTIDPDIIINSAGIFGNNSISIKKIFTINVAPSWEIIRYYLKKIPKNKKLIILIGSTSYLGGRKNYILYAASKAALHSIYLGAKENFSSKIISLKILHPKKMKTNMTKNITVNEKSNKPIYYAKKILNIINRNI